MPRREVWGPGQPRLPDVAAAAWPLQDQGERETMAQLLPRGGALEGAVWGRLLLVGRWAEQVCEREQAVVPLAQQTR